MPQVIVRGSLDGFRGQTYTGAIVCRWRILLHGDPIDSEPILEQSSAKNSEKREQDESEEGVHIADVAESEARAEEEHGPLHLPDVRPSVHSDWSVIRGEMSGQSWAAVTNDFAPVHAPIDLHLVCASLEVWPRLVVEVLGVDRNENLILLGHGSAFLPFGTGGKVSVPVRSPFKSILQKARELLCGGAFRPVADENTLSAAMGLTRHAATARLSSVGTIEAQFHMDLLEFEDYGVHLTNTAS
ncbi:MAG: hypothetical protein MHM6MM_001894 [Cercozoa sp. M6MM]